MVNIASFSEFVSTNVTRDLDVSGSYSKILITGRIKASDNKSTVGNVSWVANGNNWLVLISNVRIKNNTWYSRTEVNWKNERTSRASATMLFDFEVYGPRIGNNGQSGGGGQSRRSAVLPTGGKFTKTGNAKWIEKDVQGNIVFRFRQVKEDSQRIVIRDDTRGFTLSLPKAGGPTTWQYDGQSPQKWNPIRWE
jgi:hypothetical protein